MDVAGGTAEEPGFTMIANPRLTALHINNDIDWGSTSLDNDMIVIPNGTDKPTTLWRQGGKWTTGARRYVYDPVTRSVKSVYVTDFTIPAGTGFWYHRYGASFTVTVMPEGTVK